jgi:hypothetical protein
LIGIIAFMASFMTGPRAAVKTSDATDPRGSAVAPPSRRTTWVAYASAASATIGFIPLHLVWALDIPLWADADRFHAWHQDGGGTYLFALNALALLPALLVLALVRPWGLMFPRWVPWLAGRRVPRMLLIMPGAGLSVLLLAYTVFAAALAPSQWNDPAAIFEPWIVLYGVPQFLVWVIGLIVATHSYARRTAPTRQT